MDVKVGEPHVTRKREVTFLGVPAVVWEVRTAKSATCRRVGVTCWVGDASIENGGYPAGTVVLTHCTGDGQRVGFVLHGKAALAEGTSDEEATRLAEMLLAWKAIPVALPLLPKPLKVEPEGNGLFNRGEAHARLAELGFAYSEESGEWVRGDDRGRLSMRPNPADPASRVGPAWALQRPHHAGEIPLLPKEA